MKPLSIEALLPHGDAIRFVQRIVEAGPEGAVVEAMVGDGAPLASGGRFPCFLILEAVAQASAVQRASASPDSAGPPASGYLVTLREVEFHGTTFPTNTSVVIRLTMTGFAPPLGTFDFEVTLDAVCIARGSMGTYLGGPAESASSRSSTA